MEQKAYMLFYVFDRKSSNMKKSSIIQNGIIPGFVNKAIENSWNHNTGVRNGISVSSASMVKEVTLHKMGSSNPVNSLNNSKHAGSELSNLKTDVCTALGCLQQSAASMKASSNATVSSAGSAGMALVDANAAIVNEHSCNNRITKQAPEEKWTTPSDGDSRSCVTSSCTVSDNIHDVSKTETARVRFIHKSIVLPTNDANAHIHSPKKMLTANVSAGCQVNFVFC